MSWWLDKSYAVARRIAIAGMGATLLLMGAVLLVTPGPGLLVLGLGLGVLALEFAWARRWLRRLRESASWSPDAPDAPAAPAAPDDKT